MPRQLDPGPTLKPRRFAHFVLRVRDLARSIAWYEQVIGMEVVHGADKLAFLTFDGEHHRLALLETPVAEAAPPGCAGLDHVAFAFDSMGELLSTYKRLQAAGIEPFWPINHGPSTSLYYRDPDGHGVELFFDNFESEEELKGWMRSEAFEANPIGVRFDPEKLVERYLAGDPISELVKQGAA